MDIGFLLVLSVWEGYDISNILGAAWHGRDRRGEAWIGKALWKRHHTRRKVSSDYASP